MLDGLLQSKTKQIFNKIEDFIQKSIMLNKYKIIKILLLFFNYIYKWNECRKANNFLKESYYFPYKYYIIHLLKLTISYDVCNQLLNILYNTSILW